MKHQKNMKSQTRNKSKKKMKSKKCQNSKILALKKCQGQITSVSDNIRVT